MKLLYSRAFLFKTATLFAVWMLLSQTLNPMHVSLGFLASVAIAWFNTGGDHSLSLQGVHPVRALLYFPWLLWKVLQSGLHVSYLIIHPRLPIDPKVIRYQTQLASPLAMVTLGNSITLTPGTITVEVRPNELIIHAMDEASTGDLISLQMEKQVAKAFEVSR